MSLKYAKNAVVKGFVGVPDEFAFYGQGNTFADATTATPQQRVDEIFSMANDCRDGSTIFSDEQAFLPVSQGVPSVSIQDLSMEDTASSGVAPEPPMRKKEHPYVNALLIGVGVFVLYKILS